MNTKTLIYNVLRSSARLLRDVRIDVNSYFLRIINSFIRKREKHLFFFPHNNCKNDGYDILNNKADNVLVLCDSILQDERFHDCCISIMIYDKSKLSQYMSYVNNKSHVKNIRFIYFKDSYDVFFTFCRSSVIFTDNFYNPFLYKTNRQKVICLGYFVFPFKDDYFKIKRLGYKQALRTEKKRNRAFDYHISTSDLCSRELSVDSLLYLPKYVTLGFPRNDIFYSNCSHYRTKIIEALGFMPKTIISFVPTHRDYERKTHYLYDEKRSRPHSLFGVINDNDEKQLNEYLEKENIVIIAKAHPIQEQSIITKTIGHRIFYYKDLLEKCNTNLQEIMAASDMLVTDYSTACFDFLLTNKPSIFYFYDYDVQREYRKFFIESVYTFCAGDIVYDIHSFIEAITDNLNNPDKYEEKRHLIRDMLFYHNDGKSTDRIKDFVLDIVRK